MGKDKFHLNIVVIGHVDAGKSTATGHLIYKCGGIDKRTIEKFEKEAAEMGKASFKYAWVLDKLKAERERGITIDISLWKFETAKFYFTIIDAPGHRDFIKNMITGSSQADVALLMVPADGNFVTSIAKGNLKAGEVQGQTRQHALLINLLGVKQLIVGVNKMDCDVAKYGKERYDEVSGEMANMLQKVGWKKEFIKDSVPMLPISGWMGDNLIKKSDKMPWWTGVDIAVPEGPKKGKVHVHTLLDALESMVYLPVRNPNAAMRLPISGVYKIKGTGDVLTGRVEQGMVKPGQEVVFIPTHTKANECSGKVFTVEMHHKQMAEAGPGSNIGMNIKGLNKGNMPRVGDIMILKTDATLGPVKSFVAQVKVLTHPGELKVGYSPIAFVRTARSAVKMVNIAWKIGKATGGKKQDAPQFVKANEMAELTFEPLSPFVVDTFKSCEGLGRIAIMEGNSVVMLGKVITIVKAE